MSIANTYNKIKNNLRDRIRLHESYQVVFQSPDGEKVLRHIMKVGNVTKPSFVAGDPHSTAFNEGRRHLALSILRFVGKDHKKLIQMIEEGTNDEDQNTT